MGGFRKSKHLASKKGKISKNEKFRNSKKGKKEFAKKKTEKGKQIFCFNRYRDKNHVEEQLIKKRKIEEQMQQQYETSDSEEDVQDPMQQLLSTFSGKGNNTDSVPNPNSSEESSESDEENISSVHEEKDALELNANESNENGNKCDYLEEVPIEESIEEKEIDIETEKDDKLVISDDPFMQHLKNDLHDSLLDSVSTVPQITSVEKLNWPNLGRIIVQLPKSSQDAELKKDVKKITVLEEKTYTQPGKIPTKITNVDWDNLFVKTQIHPHIATANKFNLLRKQCELSDCLTPLQKEMFSIINGYQDFYYPSRSFTNCEEIRFIYALHSINHVLKTRTKILHHNARLFKKEEVTDDFRDQALVRPKVLIIVPFRDSAYRLIKMMIDILVPGDSSQVINKNRFENDFTGNELAMPKKNPKPEDYELTFSGNSDDTFRIGLSITKKSLKLYTEFYSSDIIIASPLGLRVIIGADGEEERDFDFLASVELLILDQTEIFLMQNWDHLLHIFDHLHLQPKKTHGTDFSRLRSWVVNGWTRYYRQTLIFSSISLPEINSLFNKRCSNYAGKVRTQNPVEAGSIRQVAIQIPQLFRRIEAKDPISALESRFDYFISEIIPQYKDSIMAHTMVYVPSYFDYVRIRNHFKKEDTSFVQICEYSKESKIARARDMFFHTEAHFLLYSERFHFFRRMRIKGIRHILFYQPPIFPHFYSEMCNLMQEANQNKLGGSESNMTVTVLYTKYDLQQLSAIVGSERTAKMASSDRNVHMFMTGE